MTRALAIAVAALAIAACKSQPPAAPTSTPPTVKTSALPGTTPPGIRHTERLATAMWHGGTFSTCADAVNLKGCRTVTAEPPPPSGATFTPDPHPYHWAPGTCHVSFDDAAGPGVNVASASMVGPGTHVVLDTWHIGPTDNGDYFAVETSFSPDGKWLAIIHTGVSLGVDERTVEIASVRVIPAPPCS